MKKVLLVLSVLLIGCTTYKPIASVDPIYGYTTNIIENEWELERLLRTDFKFRYDFAQFAMRQPLTWHWNNRMFRFGSRYNRYNYWNPYYPSNGYYYSQNYNFTYNSTQMWNDWLWGMDSGYWWNNWNTNHNNWYNGPYNNTGYNVVWNRSRRNSTMNNVNGRAHASMIQSTLEQDTNKRRVKPNVTPIVTIPTYNNKPIIRTKPVIINNNNRPSYNNKPSFNNTKPRPTINRNTKPTINRSKKGGN